MILLRHGQSEFNVVYNVTRVDPGIPDPRLTEEGRRQALVAADGALRQPVFGNLRDHFRLVAVILWVDRVGRRQISQPVCLFT